MDTPIERNKLFYSEDDYKFELEMVSDYLEEDTNQTIILYEVDRTRTNIDSVYKETRDNKSIRFKPPKELPCIYSVTNPQTKSFDNKTGSAVYMVSGNMDVYILESTLQKFKCDIKKGDYIGVQIDATRMHYFTVATDGKVNISNDMLVGAYGYPWRHIVCIPSTISEFNAI